MLDLKAAPCKREMYYRGDGQTGWSLDPMIEMLKVANKPKPSSLINIRKDATSSIF